MYSAHYTQPLLSLANTQLDGLDALLNPPFTANAIRDVLTLLQDDDGVLRTEQQRHVVFAKIAFWSVLACSRPLLGRGQRRSTRRRVVGRGRTVQPARRLVPPSE